MSTTDVAGPGIPVCAASRPCGASVVRPVAQLRGTRAIQGMYGQLVGGEVIPLGNTGHPGYVWATSRWRGYPTQGNTGHPGYVWATSSGRVYPTREHGPSRVCMGN